MARAAGVTMSETRLIEGRRGRYFATKRFDRLSGNGSFEKAAKAQGIKPAQAAAIAEEVSAAVNDFARFAGTYDLKKSTLKEIERNLKVGLRALLGHRQDFQVYKLRKKGA